MKSGAAKLTLVAAIGLVILQVAGCGPLVPTGRPASTAASQSATASQAASASATATSSATSTTGSQEELSTDDAAAIDAQLSAIEKELDTADMPSDNDFDSIGAGLQ